MKKSEDEFVNEAFSEEELSTLSAQNEEPVQEEVPIEEASPQAETARAEDPQKQEEPKTVDIRALQEARAEARAAREEAARYRSEQARIEERLRILNEAIEAQQKASAPKPPTMEEDPLAFIEYQANETKQELAALKQHQEQVRQAQQQEMQAQALINDADAILSVATQANPDVVEAFNFATSAIKQEIEANLVAQGYQGAALQQAAMHYLRQETLKYAQLMPRDPDKAAEFVRRNARYWGWSAQPQAPAQQPQQDIKSLADRQNRHMSLSNVQGGTAPTKLDITALAKMSDAEFKKLASTVSGQKQLDEIMAGY